MDNVHDAECGAILDFHTRWHVLSQAFTAAPPADTTCTACAQTAGAHVRSTTDTAGLEHTQCTAAI